MTVINIEKLYPREDKPWGDGDTILIPNKETLSVFEDILPLYIDASPEAISEWRNNPRISLYDQIKPEGFYGNLVDVVFVDVPNPIDFFLKSEKPKYAVNGKRARSSPLTDKNEVLMQRCIGFDITATPRGSKKTLGTIQSFVIYAPASLNTSNSNRRKAPYGLRRYNLESVFGSEKDLKEHLANIEKSKKTATEIESNGVRYAIRTNMTQ